MDSFFQSTIIECQDVEIEFRTWYSCTWVAILSGSSKLSPKKLLSHLGKLPSEARLYKLTTTATMVGGPKGDSKVKCPAKLPVMCNDK